MKRQEWMDEEPEGLVSFVTMAFLFVVLVGALVGGWLALFMAMARVL
jgi:hypothetical protein